MDPIGIKLVVVGDGAVGKTSMLWSFYLNKFPKEYQPTVFDNSSTTIKVDGKIVNLGLWDTAGQEEYARLRPLAYPNTDIFLIVFSVTEKSSLINAIKKWYPEVHSVAPNAVISIVGNKTDLRDGAFNAANFIRTDDAKKDLKGINCIYHQCSALTRIGLKDVFENSVREVLKTKGASFIPKPEQGCCTQCHIM